MPLTCNINARGKLVRLIWGLFLLVLGVVSLIAWAVPTGSAGAWVVTAACLLLGAFALFEARAGWCVVRAMGFKTPV